MNANIESKRRQRLEFMQRLYERTDGELLEEIPIETLAEDLGWDLRTANSVFDYLVDEGLAECPSLGGGASITHEGVREVERALTEPDRPTEHFPPAVTVNIQGDVVGSQVQTGTVHSSQHQVAWVETHSDDIARFVTGVRTALADGRVGADVRAEGEASLVAVEAQLTLDKPNPGLLREGLRSLRAIAENLIASGIWAGGAEVLGQLPPFS